MGRHDPWPHRRHARHGDGQDGSLTASYVTASTARLTISGHTGNWYYKHATGSCVSTAVSGATTTATGLNANTSYVFSAYSNSSCTNLLGTASAFTTADVSVSNLSETADGNVTIGTHSSNSYIEKWATAFTTGSSNSPGYTVTTVAAKFNTKNGTPGAIAVESATGAVAVGDRG